MKTIQVERTLNAPIDRVFDLLTDHADYKRFPGINDSELLKEGDRDRNGVGAMRYVQSRPFRFEEEITEYERPTRMSYLIRKINAPLEHDGGTIELSEADGGTRAVWTSTFTVPTPVIGGAVERLFWSPALRRGFTRVLKSAERQAASPSGAPAGGRPA
jgi:uncharacterized protein YndB with AHSA1/START domain